MARLVLRGRSAEMTHALGTLRRAVRTRHSAVLSVAGPAGIGKTAFVTSVADEARSLGFRAGLSQAGPETRAIPGGALLVALRSGPQPLLDSGDFTELAALYERPIWLIDRIGDVLATSARSAPLLVTIDDVDLTDDLTRLALKLLPARLSALPIVWMLTSRTLSTGVLDETVAAAETAAVARISLGPLSGADIDDLARDRLGEPPTPDVGAALGAAGGSPFWADQIVRGLTANGSRPPETADAEHIGVLVTTRRRLTALTAGATELVRLAAAWGQPLTIADATALLGGPRGWIAESVQEATAGGVLVRNGDAVSFPHTWVRDAVYAEVTPADRRYRHRRCADLLLDRPGEEEQAVRHLRLAETDDAGLTRRLLRTATERIGASPAGAAALARHVWHLVAELSGPAALGPARAATEILGATERHADVVVIVDAVLAADLTGPEAALWWRLAALHALVAAGRWDAAARRIDVLLDDERITGAPRSRLEALRAAAAAGDGPRSALPAIADRADQVLADPAAEVPARRLAATTRATAARRLSRFGDAWRAVAGVAVAPTPASTAERVRALQDIDRLDQAAPLLEAVGAGATADGDFRHLEPSVLLAAARQELDIGHLAAAETRARVLAAQARETLVPAHRIGADVVLAEVALRRGDPFDFATADLPESPVVEWSMGLRIMHATAALRGDDVDGALRLIMPAVSAYQAGYCSSQWSAAFSRPLLAVALRAGNRQLAAAIQQNAELAALHNDRVASWVGVARQAAAVLAGDPDALGAAVDVLRTGPRPLLLADALTDQAELLVTVERQSDAVPLLEEAAGLYARAGAAFEVKRTSVTLTRLGVRRRRDTPASGRAVTGWPALTDTEQLVAGLISAGHTNRSAATELGISPNTINTHLRSVFGKLGVRSRVQLANVVREVSSPA